MPTFIRGLWIVAILGALFAIYLIVLHVRRADSSEHQAQCSAVALLAGPLAPYCLARAVEEAARKRNS